MTTPPLEPEFTWVHAEPDLVPVAEHIRASGWVALDTESNSMFAYRERVCLLQLNSEGRTWVVDPIEMTKRGATGIEGLRGVLEDPEVRVFLHGGEYDVAVLKREYEIALRGVFDTQQAAAFLGFERTSYGVVVLETCGVSLPKGHKQHDWGRRPIDSDALRYAVADVTWLPTVARVLEQRITSAELEEELALANLTVEEAAPHRTLDDPARVHRLTGARELNPSQMGVLVALYALRDELGQLEDMPPARLVANELLVALARKSPTSTSDFGKLRLRGNVGRKYGQRIVTCITRALEEPPEIPPIQRPPARSRAHKNRESRFKTWRREEADRRGVPLQVVLPARAIEHLCGDTFTELSLVPELGPKRLARYGTELLRLRAG